MLLQSRNLTVPEKVILRGHTTSAAPFLQVTSAFIQQGILVLLQLCTPAVDVTIYYANQTTGILPDPGADKGGEGKSKRAEKYIWNEQNERKARRASGDNVLPDQFQTVASVLASDWCQKNTSFLASIRSRNGGDRLELVW